MNSELLSGFFGFSLLIAGLIIGIMWLVVPIFIYQIKKKLEEQVHETRETRWAIKHLINTLEKQQQDPK